MDAKNVSVLACLGTGQALQVRNALLKGCVFLGWGDGSLNVTNDPVHHMLLLHTPHNIGSLKLVVQPFLNLGVGILEPRPIHSLQLESNSFLLGSNNIFPCRGVGLASLLSCN